jgi:DNA-binding transcriptional LysR family regulator
MLKLDGIAAFVAIAEEGSISAAARRLRLPKSVVSERLAGLEKALGAVLLRRTTRKLALTEDGTVFLDRATRITREVEDAGAEIAARRGTLSGPIRISAPVTFGHMHLGPALYPFLAAHPGIALTLDLDDRRVSAATEGFDAILRHGPIDDNRLVVWKLAPSRRVLVASPDYLRRAGAPRSLDDLDRHRGIFYTNRGAADWRFVEPEGNAIVVRGQAAFRANNGTMVLDAAIAGLGIALLPTFIAGPAIKDGRLIVFDLDTEPEAEWIYLAHAEGRHASAKLRALADHLKHAFGDPPYWEIESLETRHSRR